MIIAALLGALTFGACVDTEESSSVKAIRDAKAEQLKSVATLNNAKAQAEATIAAAEAQIAAAQAQLLAAQAAKVQAEAAAINAETEAQKIANQQAAAEAEQKIAEAEAEIARIQAQLEMDLLTYQTNLLAAQLNFNKAMQGLAAQEKENLTKIYAAYNAALSNLAAMTAQKIELNADIAELQADIAEHEATIESLTAEDAQAAWDAAVAAAEKAVADATTAVNAKKADAESKAALVEELRALGAVSYPELTKEVENALKAKNTASDNKLLATKKYDAALKAGNELFNKANALDTDFNKAWGVFYAANSAMTGAGRAISNRNFKVGVDENGADVFASYGSFLPVTWNTTSQSIVDEAETEAIALISYQTSETANIYDIDDENYDAGYNYTKLVAPAIFAEGVAAYAAEVNEYIEATDGITVKNLTEKYNIAYANVTAYVATQGAAAVNLLSQLQTLEAQQASLEATIAAKNASLATLQQQLKVYDGVTETDAVKAAKKVINDQITAINNDLNKTNADVTKAGLTFQLTDVKGKINTLKANYNFTAYNAAKDALDAATYTYNFNKNLAAEAVAALDEAVVACEAQAELVAAANEAQAATCTAGYDLKAKNQAYKDANDKYTTLHADWSNAAKWGDRKSVV